MVKTITNLPIETINWPVSNVQAFTTCRQKNKQQREIGCYDHFNLGLHVGDNPQKVQSNREELNSILPVSTKIQWLEQVHGADVVTVNRVSNEPIVADAAITQQPNVALAVMTADCLPILLANENGSEIAAIHGGWRPLAGNIVKHTINQMQSNASDLVAWLGPCIGPDAFEVGEDVKKAFMTMSALLESAFSPKGTVGKYYANLHKIARLLLAQAGVENCEVLDECTYNLSEKYYSYRREPQTGRMATIICRR